MTGPTLFDVTIGGKPVKGLASLTKTCYVYALHRATGEPIFPIVETAVPTKTDVPGEEVWPTQPIPYSARHVPQQPFCATYSIVADRAAQAAIDELATNEAALSKRGSHMLAQAPEPENGRPSEGLGGGLPPELRAELRRLLAAILVADVRAYPTVPQEVGPSESLTIQPSAQRITQLTQRWVRIETSDMGRTDPEAQGGRFCRATHWQRQSPAVRPSRHEESDHRCGPHQEGCRQGA